MATYMWNPKMGGFMKADAEAVGRELEMLEEVTPANVLEYAKDPDSELHKCFTWSDTEAANKYRLLEARRVIQFIMVRPDKQKEQPKRVFQITSKQNVYKPTVFFQKNADEYETLLARAKQACCDLETRFKSLSEMESIFEAIHETF